MSKYQSVQLGSVMKAKVDNRGKTPPLSDYGYPLLEVKHILENQLYPSVKDTKFVSQETWDSWFRAHLEPEDILFSTVGSIARSCIVPNEAKFCIAQNVVGIRIDSNVAVARYVYYALRSTEFVHNVDGYTITTVQDSIKVNDLVKCYIPLPPLPIQKRIAEILGRLDDKIEVNRRINRTLEAMAQALYKHWFVDFGPFQDGPFVDSELGPIPEGWRIGRLDDIASVEMGASPDGSSYNSNGIGTPLINGPVEFGEYFAVKSKWTTQPTKLCQIGDLILCVRGSTTGRRVYADDVYCIGRGVCAIRAKNSWQTFVNLTVDYRLADLLLHTTGSVFPSLSSSDIRGFKVALPSGSPLCL